MTVMQEPAASGPTARRQDGLVHSLLRFLARLPLTAKIGGVMVAVVVLIAIFAPLLVTHDPTTQSMIQRNRGFSAAHWLGTDAFGRDVYSRLIVGARYSLAITTASLLAAAVVGTFLGLAAAYNRGGKLDIAVVWLVDVLMTFPTLILGVIVVAIFGPGPLNVALAISVAFLPRLTRMARGVALSIVSNEYIEAARAIGASPARIIARHLLPNIMSEMTVITALWLGTGIEVETSLSFLGLGVQPPTPSWGLMIKEGIGTLYVNPWPSLLPVAAILFVILGLNLLVDGIQELKNPGTRDG
ncbi:ABC transporter permease [Chelatococcus sp. GCM10030263]|uniref:ABC transporter permease n=1 Tax=Chelatococcus sp. GCM10030263 TaxID=3273387 RepID=UPI00360E63C0